MDGEKLDLRDARLLAAAVRSVRKLRGLGSRETARRMNLSPKTYENFEGGRGKPNIDYVHRFCDATDSDPYAVLTAMVIGSPDFAARAADNKLVMILVIALKAFDHSMGDRISRLDPRTLIAALEAVFEQLERQDAEDAREAAAWISHGVQGLTSDRPGPGR